MKCQHVIMNNYFTYLKIIIYISSAIITITLINNVYFKIHVILKVENIENVRIW